jgi:hypothetical protein
MRIDFFIAGVQKAGTSALDKFLRGHPLIQMARSKELHFFDDETINWSQPNYERLHCEFNWDAQRPIVRGESTPIYTYWPGAVRRLRRYSSAAKIIVALRHPSFRAHSHWRMEVSRRRETLAFADAISELGRNRVSGSPNGVHRTFSYVERGYYARQIAELQLQFPRDQILFFRTDRLWDKQQDTLDAIQDFLGVERHLTATRKYVTPIPTQTEPLRPETRGWLDNLFADDIRRTANLSGLSLADWLDPHYREPMKLEADSLDGSKTSQISEH